MEKVLEYMVVGPRMVPLPNKDDHHQYTTPKEIISHISAEDFYEFTNTRLGTRLNKSLSGFVPVIEDLSPLGIDGMDKQLMKEAFDRELVAIFALRNLWFYYDAIKQIQSLINARARISRDLQQEQENIMFNDHFSKEDSISVRLAAAMFCVQVRVRDVSFKRTRTTIKQDLKCITTGALDRAYLILLGDALLTYQHLLKKLLELMGHQTQEIVDKMEIVQSDSEKKWIDDYLGAKNENETGNYNYETALDTTIQRIKSTTEAVILVQHHLQQSRRFKTVCRVDMKTQYAMLLLHTDRINPKKLQHFPLSHCLDLLKISKQILRSHHIVFRTKYSPARLNIAIFQTLHFFEQEGKSRGLNEQERKWSIEEIKRIQGLDPNYVVEDGY